MYLGIDLGTSSVKVLVGSKDELITSVSVDYPLYQPQPLYSEQNPLEWWNGVQEAILSLPIELRSKVKSIAFSGQMHGLVALDEKGSVLRNAILWNDQRTIQEVEDVTNEQDYTLMKKECANQVLTGFTAPKLLWMRKHEPELFSEIAMWLLPKDYISYRFSNRYTTDHSDCAGTFLYNVEKRDYSDLLLQYCSLTREQCPTIIESCDIIGNIDSVVAKELGLPLDCVILPGGADQAMAGIGTGCIHSQDAFLSLGTSGVLYVASDNFKVDESYAFHSFASGTGKYYQMGVILAAAASLKWWVEDVLEGDFNQILASAQQTSIEDSVFYLPYLSGERTPINDPYASGTFVGLGMNHKQAHMSRAVLEGVAFALRDCYEELKKQGVHIPCFRVNGGGAKSTLWLEILANVLDARIEVLDVEAGSALGALFCAASIDQSIEESCLKFSNVKEGIEPNEKNVLLYNQKYTKFSKIYPALKEVYPLLKV